MCQFWIFDIKFLLHEIKVIIKRENTGMGLVIWNLDRSVYTFSGQLLDSISLYASSIIGTNLTTVKNTFKFILLEYNADGSLNDLKSLDDSIFSCYLNPEDIVKFQSFGLNFNKTCSSTRKFKVQYFYDVYVMAGDGTYS